jgi:archaemetzincin
VKSEAWQSAGGENRQSGLAHPSPQRSPMTEIHLVPVGRVDSMTLSWLCAALWDSLKLPCEVEEAIIDPAEAYYSVRQQYHSTQILAQLLPMARHTGMRVLGITEVDLFIPILTFVFGEAQWHNQAAVVSLHRLHQRFYGLPEDKTLFYKRSEKEALHELGHTFGLIHCSQFDCVMHFSNSIEQIDLKTNVFCGSCAGKLSQLSIPS